MESDFKIMWASYMNDLLLKPYGTKRIQRILLRPVRTHETALNGHVDPHIRHESPIAHSFSEYAKKTLSSLSIYLACRKIFPRVFSLNIEAMKSMLTRFVQCAYMCRSCRDEVDVPPAPSSMDMRFLPMHQFMLHF